MAEDLTEKGFSVVSYAGGGLPGLYLLQEGET